MSLGLSKREAAEAIQALFVRLIEGDDEDVIADAFGLDAEQMETLRGRMLDKKGKELRGKTVEHVFVEYMINQLRGVKDLDRLIKDLTDYADPEIRGGDLAKVASAKVSAIKARAALHDQILEKGQSVGIFAKEPEKKINGFLIADLTSDELRMKITAALAGLDEMTSKYGEMSIAELAIDKADLHMGAALPAIIDAEAEDVTKKPIKAPKGKKRGTSKKNKNNKARGKRVRE